MGRAKRTRTANTAELFKALRESISKMGWEPTCVDARTAARELGCTVAALDALTRAGVLLTVRVDERRMYPLSELQRYLRRAAQRTFPFPLPRRATR